MITYQLAFEDTEVARIRPTEAVSPEPLAWFRVIWEPGSNNVKTVHVYGHAAAISDRPWLGQTPTIAAAVAFCGRLDHRATDAGDYDWAGGSIETSRSE